jgi:hypothetical protein
MKRFLNFRVALLAAVILAGLAADPQQTNAVPPNPVFPPDVRGSWDGFYQSDMNADMNGAATLDIMDQVHRRFEGIISLVAVPPNPVVPPNPIRGTVSASGRINMISHGETAMVAAHGELVGNTMLLVYQIHFSDGSHDRGTMTLFGGSFDDNTGF